MIYTNPFYLCSKKTSLYYPVVAQADPASHLQDDLNIISLKIHHSCSPLYNQINPDYN